MSNEPRNAPTGPNSKWLSDQQRREKIPGFKTQFSRTDPSGGLGATGAQGPTGPYAPEHLHVSTHREQKLQQEIEELRRQLTEVQARDERKEEELRGKERLQFVLMRIHQDAKDILLASQSLQSQFLKEEKACQAFVLSVDIRRSTELMLKARSPELYARFLVRLCKQLEKIILESQGVFDKFTGDGILAFFPEFYSGEDAALRAVKAAEECHQSFERLYKEYRHSFEIVLKDVGLGIGIDYGETHLVKTGDRLTVVGTPVVYACRLSGGTPGKILLNQRAYEELFSRFSAYCILDESELDITHEGRVVAYEVRWNGRDYQLAEPGWRKYDKDRSTDDSSGDPTDFPTESAEGA